MISLSRKLEKTVITGVGELNIDLSFNTVLKWYELVSRDDVPLPNKIRTGWVLFLGDTLSFNDLEHYEIGAQALENITEYISQDPYSHVNNQQNINDDTEHDKWFSYKEDAEAIYASFLFDYNIDLVDVQDKLRWEKFRALFNNLSPKSPIMRIVEIRQADPSDYEGKGLADLMQAKSYYELDGQSVNNLNNAVGGMFDMLKGMM